MLLYQVKWHVLSGVLLMSVGLSAVALEELPLPKMISIPAGSFLMGCDPQRDDVDGGCSDNEKPAHNVDVAAFQLAETEVTNAQYQACVQAATCQEAEKLSSDPNTANNPVSGVGWSDAQVYVQWLRRVTGKAYRLPSEAEWEYAARGGGNEAYSWGNKANHEYANYGKDECCDGLASGRDRWVGTSPVASFPDNGYGLYDMHGNVYEWLEDCYHDSYVGAPTHSTAWTDNGCSQRVVRGGSWRIHPHLLRSAYRIGIEPVFRNDIIGIRVALDQASQ